ncbi:MAG: CyaA/EF/ExoY family adenylyl cyclase toxin [Gemmatimonadota bacterium]|jgi:hypothetical protein|nr:CyaA/EF/ExoY family adenylyl cyclase toxin [Gemmatimonadota bacterium]
MGLFSKYDKDAGFPKAHLEVFQTAAKTNNIVISSRELNPCCTDLVLESYAAKGFHIKAKTCDWGPAAGFVVADPRFIKGSTTVEKQTESLKAAFEYKVVAIPLFISKDRLQSLIDEHAIKVASQTADRYNVTAFSEKANRDFSFVLHKVAGKVPGGEKEMWGVYYDPKEPPQAVANQTVCGLKTLPPGVTDTPTGVLLHPVMGLVNPGDADGSRLGVRSAVAGDYDLFCIFTPKKLDDVVHTLGINNRPMPLRATVQPTASEKIKRLAHQGGHVFADGKEKAEIADKKEDPHQGNISFGVMKIKNSLNAACRNNGYKGGNIVQHSDYGGNPFGEIDYPLIFFIPKGKFVEVKVVTQTDGISGLKKVFAYIRDAGFEVTLNPAWNIPNFELKPPGNSGGSTS